MKVPPPRCSDCGGPVTRGYRRCLTCSRKFRQVQRDLGLHRCLDCGAKVTKRSTGRCRSCRARFSAAQRRLPEKACLDCGVTITRQDAIKRCRPCAQKLRSAHTERVAPRLCIECGAELRAHSKRVQRCKACAVRLMPRQDTATSKACSKCGETKPPEEFYWKRDGKRRYAHCRACQYLLTEEWRKRNRLLTNERARHYNRAQMLGIGIAEYRSLGIGVLADGATECEVCRISVELASQRHSALCVDHDHATGQVRGILCASCNRAAGLLGDDPGRLRDLAEYLERHPKAVHEGATR